MIHYTVNKPVKVKVWFTDTEIRILFDRILPKLISLISDDTKKNHWQKFINNANPNYKLDNSINELLLQSSKISNEQIIENSILYVWHNIKRYDLDGLVKAFSDLCEDERIIFTTNTNLPIFPMIVGCMQYVESIRVLFEKYPKRNSEHHGTAHRGSSYQQIIKTQISSLEARLNHTYFPLTSVDEIKKTEVQLRFLKMTQKQDFSNLPEYFNYAKINFGIDSQIVGLSEQEQLIFEQLLDFYNGIKSSKQELLKSVMIVINFRFNKSSLEPLKKAEVIREIIRYTFNDEFTSIRQKRNNEIFYKDDVTKPYKIKTILHDVPIYVTDHGKGNNFLEEFMTIGINTIFGIRSLFDSEAPTIDEANDRYILRNLFSYIRTFSFDRKERRVFYRFFDSILSKYAEGNFPLQKIGHKTTHDLQLHS